MTGFNLEFINYCLYFWRRSDLINFIALSINAVLLFGVFVLLWWIVRPRAHIFNVMVKLNVKSYSILGCTSE